MKLKRTLSILLSAALTISSFPIIVFAESQANSTPESDSSNLFTETNWQANGGSLTLEDNVLDTAAGTVGAENGADTNDYIHVSLGGENAMGPGIIYQDSGVTLKPSTKYLLSVWLRSSNLVSNDSSVTVDDKTIIIDIGNHGNALSMVGQHTGFKTLSTNTVDPNNDVFFISDEWQKFNFVFETDAGSAINFAPGAHNLNGLIFRYANRNAAHQAPFDIDGLALYEVDGTYQPINSVNLFTKTENINAYYPITNHSSFFDTKGTTVEMRTEEAYYHAASVDGGVPTLVYGELDLTPGKYTFTGDFKLSDINYEVFSGNRNSGEFFNTALLTAELDGASIGNTSLTADDDFKNVKFSFDVKNSITDAVLTLKLSENLDLDFGDLKLVKTYSYPENENWVGTNDVPIPSYSSGEKYVEFEQADGYKYQFNYKTGNTLAAGDYKLSVTMRFDPDAYAETDYANYINGTKASNSRGCIVDNGIVVGVNSGVHNTNILTASADTAVLAVTSFNKDGETSDNAYALGIDDEWHTFDIEFTLKQAQTLQHFGAIVFFYNIRSDFTIPVQISDFSLVNTTTKTEYSQGMDIKYWNYKKGNGYDYDVTITEEIPSYSTENIGVKAIKPTNLEEILLPGIYTVEGMVRADAGNTTLTFAAGSSSASANVGTDWRTVKLRLDLRETVPSDSMNISFGNHIDFTDFEITSENYPILDGWSGTYGEAIPKVSDETFIQFEQADGYKYQFNYKAGSTLAAGDYKLSVRMRFDPDAYAQNDYASYVGEIGSRGCVVDGGIVVAINSGSHNTNGTNNLLRTDASYKDVTTTSFLKDGVAAPATELAGYATALTLDDEWHTFEIYFTLANDQTLEHFGAVAFLYNIRSAFTIPVQVSDISLVNITTSEEYTKGMDAKYWNFRKDSSDYKYDVAITEVNPYYSTDGTGISAIKPTNIDEILFPGMYTVKGKMRASSDASTLTLAAGTASASVEVGTAWQDVELRLDLRETVSSDLMELTFNCDYIDFSNLEITSDVYAILESWGGENDEALVKVSDETYLQFEADGNKYQFYYKAGDMLEAGDYTLSVTMRFDPDSYYETDYANYINGTKSENPRGCLVDNGIVVGINALTHGYPAGRTLIENADNDVLKVTEFNKDGEPSVNGLALAIDGEWHTFDIKFTLKQSQSVSSYGAVVFFNNIRSDFTIPVQIKDFSLVNTSTDDEYTKGLDVEYWNYNTYAEAGYNGATSISEIPPYYTTNGMNVSSIKPINTTAVFTPGVYTITGMFKAHGDSATLTASVLGGSNLATNSGLDSVELTDTWRKVTFVLDTVVGFDYSDLRIIFTDNIDIAYIEIEQQERHLSSENINPGTLMTLLLLKKLMKPANSDNLLENAASKAMLRKWSYGDQTLTYHKDQNGDYLRASNIKSNIAGFTYKPGVTLPAGVYFFSGEFRAANDGEVTRIRVMAGDKTGISEFTNEWKKLEFIFELTKSGPLSIKICGASSALDIQDYEFRNLSLINSDNYPGGYNFFPRGEMPEEGTNGWYSLYGGIYGRVTWTKEDDGNIYLSFVDRALNHDGVKVDTGITLVPGAKYTVSYDIRATNPGEELTIRAFANDSELIVTENASNENGNEFDITHEWRHVESQFMANEREKLSLSIRGGQDAVEDIRSFDFDNVVITKVGGATDEDLYPKGNFDDKNLTLSAWGQSYGSVKFTWNVENGDDGYVTLSERNPMYAAGTFATVKAEPGTTYIISYDIRTTNKGDTMGVRARINDDDIFVSHARNAYGNEYWINDEWKHVESLWTAKTDDVIVFSIRAGSNMETDQKDFDINNLKIAIAP